MRTSSVDWRTGMAAAPSVGRRHTTRSSSAEEHDDHRHHGDATEEHDEILRLQPSDTAARAPLLGRRPAPTARATNPSAAPAPSTRNRSRSMVIYSTPGTHSCSIHRHRLTHLRPHTRAPKVRARAALGRFGPPYPVVLSLWKLRVGAEAYYLAQVAGGLDDYYTGDAEVPGRWAGAAAPLLGLSGEVDGADLRAVLAGLAPGTGLTPNGTQLRAHPRRVPGFDLTFSVPKSVSVLYAIADPTVREQIIASCEQALADTLAWVEREACHVRRGTNNTAAKVDSPDQWGTRRHPGAGFVAAQFRHRTSRAGDPHLHWHVLVANLTAGPDGRWTALDGTSLYRTKRTAGVVFQAAVRHHLTSTLDVAWGSAHGDVREIAGVPQRVLRMFSKRRVEIEAELDRVGGAGAAAAEAATLATRTRKVTDERGLDERWLTEATTIGWGRANVDTLLAQHHTTAVRPSHEVLVHSVSETLRAHDSTLTRHDVTTVVATAAPAGLSPVELDRTVAAVLADPSVVTMHPASSATGWEARVTTRSHLELEAELLSAIDSDDRPRRVAERALDHALATHPMLHDEQRAAVLRLCTRQRAVEVMVGRAGTGKTTTLAAVAAAYTADGSRVIGVAPSARAARELADGAHVDTFTVPRFHYHVTDQRLDGRSVVIVDEAGMCGTVDLHSIVTTATSAGAKVILVGDHHQLPEVTAGGGFRAAVARAGTDVVELTVNRRQHERWEIDALDQLRHGNPHLAFDAYRIHGRIHLAGDTTAVHEHATFAWWTAHQTGARTLMLAGTRSEAEALNRRARSLAAIYRHVTGPELVAAGRVFQAGDRVLATRNTTMTGVDGSERRVDNGMLGTITRVRPGRSCVVRFDHGTDIVVPAAYVDDGHLTHGYAMTVHKSQGATCDHAIVVGPAGLHREAAYVALSRARRSTHIYLTVEQADTLTELDHATGIPLPADQADPETVLVEHFTRSAAKHLATDLSPHALAASRLAQRPLHQLEARLAEVVRTERHLVRCGHQPAGVQRAAVERAEATRGVLEPGRRCRALDRDNVGTVLAVDDRSGTATVHFVNLTGRQTTRTMRWEDLKVIDHPHPVEVSDDARGTLTERRREADRAAVEWIALLAANGVQPDERAVLTAAIALRAHRAALALASTPPGWLTATLGHRPADLAGAARWDHLVERIAAWRDRHAIPDAQPRLGDRPTGRDGQQWDALATHISDYTRRQPEIPVSVTPLDPKQVVTRLAELDALLATCPPDGRSLVDAATRAGADPGELHQALVVAHGQDAERRRWILANWPHVVEHEQLQRIAADLDPLDQSPWPDVLGAELNHL